VSITPRSFDPHAESIDGPAYAWSDPEISRLDLMENRQWVRDAVAKVQTAPVPYVALVSIVPDEPVQLTKHIPVGVWITPLLVVVAALLAVAVTL
jgi:hypothetical protein